MCKSDVLPATKMSGFVAVHLGAGYHSSDRQADYKEAVSKACQEVHNSFHTEASTALRSGISALDAVTIALTVLEDCPCTNAGLGSNLTLGGSVECDAGIMDGSTMHFGAVGAVAGLKNPIKVARAVLCEQQKGMMSCGRTPPCILVGNGALQWAQDHAFKEVHASSLITPRALSAYRKQKRMLEKSSSFTEDQHKMPKRQKECVPVLDEDALLDTVGAICVDSHGQVASGVSSGGIALKHSGRLGHAVMFGCGCWAQSHTQSFSSVSIACSTSGNGEQLMRCCLARTCCDSIRDQEDPSSALGKAFSHNFLKSPYLDAESARLAGTLVVKYSNGDKDAEVLWCHSTYSMCVGYMGMSQAKPKMIISRLPSAAEAGTTLALGGASVTMPT